MAIVYLARDLKHARSVALKVAASWTDGNARTCAVPAADGSRWRLQLGIRYEFL